MGCDSDETKSTIRQDFLFGQVTLFIAAKHVATFLFINIFIFGMVVWEWWIMAIPYRFPSNLAIKSSGPLHDLLFLFNQKTYFKHACQEYNVNSKFFTPLVLLHDIETWAAHEYQDKAGDIEYTGITTYTNFHSVCCFSLIHICILLKTTLAFPMTRT